MNDDVFQFFGGLAGVLIFILDLLVVREVFISDRDILSKVAWTALILLFPVGGVIMYLLFAHRSQHAGYNAIV